MISVLLLALVLGFTTSAQNLKPAEQYYNELGCTPVIEKGDTSPSRYNCSVLASVKENQCYHRNKIYERGARLPQGEASPCRFGCRCQPSSNGADFICAMAMCRPPKPKPGCHVKYEHGTCCPSKTICESAGNMATCKWEGKTYKEGHTFKPSGSCMNCVCMKGFNGTIGEPWCRRISCDITIQHGSLVRKGCVPLYNNPAFCCPSSVFRCPAATDKVEGEPIQSSKSSSEESSEDSSSIRSSESEDLKCTFGKLKLSRGQKLNNDPEHECARCSCEVPPHVTCTMDKMCRLARVRKG